MPSGLAVGLLGDRTVPRLHPYVGEVDRGAIYVKQRCALVPSGLARRDGLGLYSFLGFEPYSDMCKYTPTTYPLSGLWLYRDTLIVSGFNSCLGRISVSARF